MDYYTHTNPGGVEDLWNDDVPVHQTGYATELFGARAVEVIDAFAKSGNPFFLSLHFSAPHWPWEAPGDQPESARIRGKGLIGLMHFDGGSQETYRRMISAMDLQIGRVLQVLAANGIEEKTIIVFTSDNGGERFADTWPFTGRKTELLEGGLRIPAIISWPDRIPRGRTTDQVTINMDWLPTLLAAASTEPNPAYPSDGIDLLPMLTAEAAAVPRKLFWRYKANWQRAVREGDFKYLKILDNTFLFNVVQDPMERANLRAREPEIYNRLVAEWKSWNSAMLPEIPNSYTDNFTGDQLADHIGTKHADGAPDPELVRPIEKPTR